MDKEKEYYSLIQKAFDALAPFYNLVALPISSVRGKVVAHIGTPKGSRILDIATGTGQQALAFGEKGYEVVGVDLSEAMLGVARRNNRYGNVRFEVADAAELAFPDRSFDVSCLSFALHDMPLTIMGKALKEMVRVTKPNGTIVIVDYGLPENRIGKFIAYHLVKLYEGPYYRKFIRLDLERLLVASGIEVEERIPVLLGAGRIITGHALAASRQVSRDQGPHNG